MSVEVDRSKIAVTDFKTNHRYKGKESFTIQGKLFDGEWYDTKHSFHSIDQCLDYCEKWIKER